jgi:2-polyprenyl-6-methoxyphenol hydroxylase-like FAD-dependent oxidoreductase
VRIGVIGGSLGGMMAALVLTNRGHEVTVHERSAAALSGRGAGIVSHQLLIEALAAAGIGLRPAELGVEVARRRVLDDAGRIIHDRPFPQLLTSWDRLFGLLRAAMPEGRYLSGCAFERHSEGGDGVTAHFADGSVAEADLLIGADGVRSTLRDAMLGPQTPAYAGYIAWRGLVAESELGREAREALLDGFAFCLLEGEQMLGYPVAGPGDDLRPGKRRYNFVWYRPADRETVLRDLLTDAAGRAHELSIPPPLIRPEVVASMRADAERLLAPAFAEVVRKTVQPFFQPIHDYEAPRLAIGRAALIGDAAFVVRPHVGAGVAKAGGDALALAEALDGAGSLDAALAAYEARRLPVGRRIVARGRELGAYMQAQLGSAAERAAAAAYRTPEAVAEHTASLRFLEG